jgi:RNA polymerase sporulation-specific sigma factor
MSDHTFPSARTKSPAQGDRVEAGGIEPPNHSRRSSDTDLVTRAQQGDRDASAELVARYTDTAYGIATRFYMPGGERDDVRQEALIGILRAIRTYRPAHSVPFAGFVKMCVYRWLVTACVQAPGREKHGPLNESLRAVPNEWGGLDEAVTILEDVRAGVPELLEQRAALHALVVGLARLSPLEARCVVSIALGFSYAEIEAATGKSFKGIDTAIQRGRRRLREAA